LEAADGGAVEADTLGEEVLGELGDGNGEVLPEARKIHEAQVHDLGALVLCELNHVLDLHLTLLSRLASRRGASAGHLARPVPSGVVPAIPRKSFNNNSLLSWQAPSPPGREEQKRILIDVDK